MNSWHLNTIKFSLGLGTLMSFYGMVGFITYMLPQEYVTRTTKILIIIAMVLITMPIAMIGAYLSNRKSKKKKLAEESEAGEKAEAGTAEKVASAAAPAAVNAPQDVVAGAEEVVQFLKSSNLSQNGKDGVYSLPWYMVAGDARSGKSSLVIGSNLDFQTLPSQRQAEQKTVRPTPAIDWRVSSEALFIDSSGKYFSTASDSEEWASILETVRKHRPQRPLDGFLLVVNSERILNSDEREIEELAKTLRSRLDEAVTKFKAKFPVYLIFTNADAMEGFRDSFSTSKKEDKTLVWGATVPIEKSENAQALFDGEYEILQNSVMKRRLVRLSAPFAPVRQLRIFNFPLHFGSARRKFSGFVNTLFRPNPFSENPFLRGFYFTASPVGKAVGNMPPSVGNTYFTERLFRDVVLRDKDLTRTFIDQKARAPIFGWLMTILGALIIFALLAMSAVSLLSNRQMLAESRGVGEAVISIRKADAGKSVLAKSEADVRTELNAMEKLRSYMETLDDYERNGAPLLYRFGMYSGNEVYKKGLLPVYFGVVEKRFKEPVVQKLEADLKKFVASPAAANSGSLTKEEEENLQNQYNLFKVYLMLSGDHYEKADSALIASELKDYWVTESKVPADMKLVAEQQLAFWSRQVDRQDDGVAFPRISTDPKLVADVRQKLQVFPPILRYYGRIVSEVSKKVDDQIGTTSVETLLANNGGDSGLLVGTVPVPGAFTKPGYALMMTAIENAATELEKDDWVMGGKGNKDMIQTTDSARILEIYLREYSENWRKFVRGTSVKPYRSREEAAAALQKFAGPTSPISILMIEVAKHTNLSDDSDSGGLWAWIMSWFGSGKTVETGGNTQVEKDFRPLFTFAQTADAKDSAPIQKYQSTLGKVYEALNKINDAKMREIAAKIGEEPDAEPLKLAGRTTEISNMTQTFSETAASQEIASFLQQPLDRLKELLGGDAKTQMQKAWKDQILPAAKAIETGYPFDSSAADSDLTKLTEFLNPETGTLSVFFNEKLKRHFEESNGKLKVAETSEIQFSDEFVAYLNNAFALRQALFGTSSTPKFEYEFTLQPVAGAVVEITINGTKVTSEGTGSVKLVFPASGSTETGVLVNLANMAAAPAPAGDANSSSTVSTPSDSSLRFTGNWGLFKFVDAGNPQKQPGGEYVLGYTVSGKGVKATIRPSGGDLFNKEMFTQVRAPEAFVK